jgi:hypothetical protein
VKAKLGICIAILNSTNKKSFDLSYYAYVFSSAKLEIRAEQVLPRNEGCWGESVWEGGRGEK